MRAVKLRQLSVWKRVLSWSVYSTLLLLWSAGDWKQAFQFGQSTGEYGSGCGPVGFEDGAGWTVDRVKFLPTAHLLQTWQGGGTKKLHLKTSQINNIRCTRSKMNTIVVLFLFIWNNVHSPCFQRFWQGCRHPEWTKWIQLTLKGEADRWCSRNEHNTKHVSVVVEELSQILYTALLMLSIAISIKMAQGDIFSSGGGTWVSSVAYGLNTAACQTSGAEVNASLEGFLLLISSGERAENLLHALYTTGVHLQNEQCTGRHKVENRGNKWMDSLMGNIKLSTHMDMPAEQMQGSALFSVWQCNANLFLCHSGLERSGLTV